MSDRPKTLNEFSQPRYKLSEFLDKDQNIVIGKVFAANVGYVGGAMDTIAYVRSAVESIMDIYPEADISTVLRNIEKRLAEETSCMLCDMTDADEDGTLAEYFA